MVGLSPGRGHRAGRRNGAPAWGRAVTGRAPVLATGPGTTRSSRTSNACLCGSDEPMDGPMGSMARAPEPPRVNTHRSRLRSVERDLLERTRCMQGRWGSVRHCPLQQGRSLAEAK